MKEAILCMLALILCGCTSTPASTAVTDQDQDQEAYTLLKNYYANLDTIDSIDDLIAMEALGIESNQLELDDHLLNAKTIGSLSKTIIGLALHQDARISDYIPLLEDSILSNGSCGENTAANIQFYGVIALYIIHSDKLEIATDYLATIQNENGSFSASYGEDLDITGWCVEAFSIIDHTRYNEQIEKAEEYIVSHKIDGYYDGGYGNNADTTCSVLEGLLAANQDIQEDLKNIYYFQNKDGTYYSPTTGEGINNSYTSSEVGRLLGDYYNGNVYQKAREEYEKIN